MLKPLALAGLWLAASSTLRAQTPLTHVQLDVESTRTTWTPTGITVSPGDVVVLQTLGTISVGPYVEKVNADGAPGLQYAGALEVKIGVHQPKRWASPVA